MDARRASLILKKLEAFERLDRQATDEIGWIALQFSVSRNKAEKIIAQAREKASEPASASAVHVREDVENQPEHGMGFGCFTEQLIEDGLIERPPYQQIVLLEAERDRLRAEVEELRQNAHHDEEETADLLEQRDALADAVLPLMEKNGHFYDCLPGKRGAAPGGSCSVACQKLRAALLKAGR